MIEALIEKSVEQVVVQSETRIVKFWEKLEESAEIAPTEKVKQEKAIAQFWDGLVGKAENGVEAADKSEQVERLRKEYIDDLRKNSEYADTSDDSGDEYEKLSPEKNAVKRAEFNTNKEQLAKEWEEQNGREWPRYKEDVYVNGKLIRRAGDRYDAHHIHPLSFGGKNEATNLTPISAEKHFDKQGVHAPDSPYGKLEKTLQEAKA
jgi:hypothetical protein